MINYFKHITPLFLIILLLFGGCIKDKNSVTQPEIAFDNGAEIINYLEAKGDYINSDAAPSVIDAEQVYNNLSSFIIIDERDSAEFAAGHIEGAVNINHNNIISYIENLPAGNVNTTVLVGKNGQSTAYYAGLLRLYGFNNVYSLNFGMASWNQDFANDWLNIKQTTMPGNFVGDDFPKNGYSKLPNISFDNPSVSTEEKIKQRIKKLMMEEFIDTLYNSSRNSPSVDPNTFLLAGQGSDSTYRICYGAYNLYVSRFVGINHPVGVISYIQGVDLKSSYFLQTLPNDKRIMIYSFDGSLSAFIVAYLRLLGYNASSMLFGCSAFQTFPLIAFSVDKIKNYPYVH